MKMKFRKDDEVVVISGKEKGKVARILSINYEKNSVILEGLNKKTKHNKPSQQNTEGSITSKEAPIHISNIAYVVKKANKEGKVEKSRIGFKINKDGKKVRVVKKTGKEV